MSSRITQIEHQIQRIERRLFPLRQRSNQLSWLRVMTFLLGLLVAVPSLWLGDPWLFLGLLLLAIALLLLVVHRHNQLDQTIARFATLQQIKGEQLARLRLDWSQMPSAFAVIPSPEHPFAADLDLVGDFSLHRLLDCAASQGGSLRLFDWLTVLLPNAAEITERQRLIAELIPLRIWRERLLLNARSATNPHERFGADDLLKWLQTHKQKSLQGGLLLSFGLLGLTGFLGLVEWLGWWAGGWQVSYFAYFALQLFLGRATGESFTQASTLQDRLERLLAVMKHLETFNYQRTPQLRQLCTTILDGKERPSQLLRQVRRIVAATGIQGNPLAAFICNALFPWNLFFAQRLQRVKGELAQQLPNWLDTWYSLDALNSLATFAWLHPDHHFPEILPETTAFSFHASQLGHPLLPATSKVRNDFTIAKVGDLALITGSNMAGKSTFLRTLGLNLLLAFAGSVVDGSALQTVPLRLFTSIKISDSVTQGVSFFYAEVKRLKRLLDELARQDTLPLFFAIDEIFRGTNNRERLIGSRAYIHQLVGKQGVGLISTHDLELVKLAETLPQISNYHFRDDIVGNEMVFDYKLHPGPCPTTNALKVMRNAGLPVEET